MTEIGPDYGRETDEGTVVPPAQVPLQPISYERMRRIAALMREEESVVVGSNDAPVVDEPTN